MRWLGRVALLVVPLLAALPAARAGSISWAQIPQQDVAKALALNSPDNATRLQNLRKMFEVAGCHKESMQELPVGHAKEPDLVCTIPGVLTPTNGAPDPRRVIVMARYDHIGSGSGSVDNWSGAAMLPLLFASVLPGYREHTMQFVATYGPEGLTTFLKSLKRQEKESTVALIDLRNLGMDTTRIALLFESTADVNSAMLGRGGSFGMVTKATKDSSDAAQAAAKSSASFSDANGPASNDLRVYAMRAATILTKQTAPTVGNPYIESFMNAKPQTAKDEADLILQSGIPGVVIHSITKANAAIPGSKADSPDRIDPTAYYSTYYYTAVYVLLLDHRPDLPADKTH